MNATATASPAVSNEMVLTSVSAIARFVPKDPFSISSYASTGSTPERYSIIPPATNARPPDKNGIINIRLVLL